MSRPRRLRGCCIQALRGSRSLTNRCSRTGRGSYAGRRRTRMGRSFETSCGRRRSSGTSATAGRSCSGPAPRTSTTGRGAAITRGICRRWKRTSRRPWPGSPVGGDGAGASRWRWSGQRWRWASACWRCLGAVARPRAGEPTPKPSARRPASCSRSARPRRSAIRRPLWPTRSRAWNWPTPWRPGASPCVCCKRVRRHASSP